jgi:hypothetical protein
VRKVVHRKDEGDRDRYVLGIEKSALGSENERYSRKSRDGLSDNYSKRREQYLATVHISQIDQQWTFTLISGLFVHFFIYSIVSSI